MTRSLSISAVLVLAVVGFLPTWAEAQGSFTRADSLRGSLTAPERTWWDVTHYDLHVTIAPSDSSIQGRNEITYHVVQPARGMQIDLQRPLVVDSVVQEGARLAFRTDGNAHFIDVSPEQPVGSRQTIVVFYRGRPRIAPRPPWDGGFTFERDRMDRPWVVTTDEGIGPSVWWPMKDTWADEADSARVSVTVPSPMVHVGNGRLRRVIPNADGTNTWVWAVTNPVNSYAVNVNAGSYGHYGDIYEGERGALTVDYWPLDYNLENARRQFPQVLTALQCFEHWFGPYPWYEDGFKLVEVPYPGMEHQSAVTYGNGYENGYGGRDLSGTGLGMRWDFIIVHESAHEWFANNVTARDHADMWVHESFANYAEGLYTECLFGKEEGARYIIGTRGGILNDRPIVGTYGVGDTGSGDMYPKGGNMLHTIRQIVDDDERWRGILRGLNETFRHQTVDGADVEAYISARAEVDLGKVFDQYLRTNRVPVLEVRVDGDTLWYRWADVVPGFDMPVAVTLSDAGYSTIHPTEAWQTTAIDLGDPSSFRVDPDYYVESTLHQPTRP